MREKKFEEVYDVMVHRIHRGDWKSEEKLPSVRELANEFGVHRLTVFKAYQRLKEEGKVFVKDKSGYYIQPRTNEGSDLPLMKSHLSDIHQLPVTYQFSQAVIDPNLLPNHYFSEYVKKVFDLYPKVLGTYSTVQGDVELRDVLAKFLLKRHRLYVSGEELLITSGAQQAIHLIAQTFIRPRDTVFIERPTYSAAIDIFRHQNATIVPIDIGRDGFDLDLVERLMIHYKPRLFYMNPTFHNPTGFSIPTGQRKRLVELAETYKCLIIEDDPFHDIYFDKEPPPPIFTYDTEGLVLYIRSYSKYVAPGLRIAAVASRHPLMKSLLTAKSLTDNGSPLLNQKMFLHYFTSQRMQQHLEKLRTALQIRKEVMEQALFETGWEWDSPTGGLNLWVRLPKDVDTNVLLTKALKQSVSFVPGFICDPTHEMNNMVRFSFSYLNEKQIVEGIGRLKDVANNH
jgi:GntR family transcriptional regulator, regulator for abcA and norABC